MQQPLAGHILVWEAGQGVNNGLHTNRVFSLDEIS